jgi:hypothetical protein
MLAVVSKVVSRCLKWWGCFAGPRCPLGLCSGASGMLRQGPANAKLGQCGAVGGVCRFHCVTQRSGRLAKARHRPRGAPWQRVWRTLVASVQLSGWRLVRGTAPRCPGRPRDGPGGRFPRWASLMWVRLLVGAKRKLSFPAGGHRTTHRGGAGARGGVDSGPPFYPRRVLGNGGKGGRFRGLRVPLSWSIAGGIGLAQLPSPVANQEALLPH